MKFNKEIFIDGIKYVPEVLPVSEPVHEKIKVHSVLCGSDFNKYGIRLYNISLNRNLIEGEGEKIKQVIESCLNEPLPQPSALNDTALQELIKWLDPIHDSVIKKATELLPKERKDIEDAYKAGLPAEDRVEYANHVPVWAEDYFTNTFNQ